MAAHSSILAWRIPWIEEPGGLQSIGSQRGRHDWSNLASSMSPELLNAATGNSWWEDLWKVSFSVPLPGVSFMCFPRNISATFHVVIPMHSLTHVGFLMLNTNTASVSLTLMCFFLSYIFHPFSQHTPFPVSPPNYSLHHFIYPLFLWFHLLRCDIIVSAPSLCSSAPLMLKLCLFLTCLEKLLPFWNIPTATR